MSAAETLAPLRSWAPPSFDPQPSPLPLPPAPSLRQADIDAALDDARTQGHALGLASGLAQGMASGLQQGLAEGRVEGHRLAFEAAHDKLAALTSALQASLAEISGLAAAIAEPVVDLALLVAQRLTGSQAFERAAFVAAVQEALMHLPMPGEQLLLRLGAADEQDWRQALGEFDLPFGHVIVVDPDLPPGRVFVEVGGTRLDIGPAARQALVRSALGLSLLP
jgi:flagellar assembly protein FliH